MKKKKSECKQKHSTLVNETQVKRTEFSKLPNHAKKDIVDLVTTRPSHRLLSLWRWIRKPKTRPELIEENVPATTSRSTTIDQDDLASQMNSSRMQISHLGTTQSLPSKSKLPPLQRNPSDDSNLLSIRYIPGVCGLQNTGNTCYMNSAVQCLNSIPDIVEWAKQQRPLLSHMTIIDVYASLVQAMWSDDNEYVVPDKLKKCVSHSAPIFSNYDQKDSHEFMNSLLIALQAVDSSSFFINLFRIRTQSKTTCNSCQSSDNTDETTTFLSLPVPQLTSRDCTNVLLEDLIKDFCREDNLDGEYYCQNCGICQSARHKTTILSPLPRVLVIQLKRFPFDGTNRKIDTYVQYQLEHHNLLSNNDKYELYAVSMHSGNLARGHYTTMARNYINNQWYRFDDGYVKHINPKHVLIPSNAQQAYILVYLKKKRTRDY